MGRSLIATLLERKQEHLDSAFESLVTEFVDSLKANPQTKIRTPGFDKHESTVADVIADHFSGKSGDADLNELLNILALAAGQRDQTGMRASALIAKMASHHARFHVADFAGVPA